MDAGSAIAGDFTPCERRVRLLRGAGFFDVAKNGPPFDVRLLDEGCVVTLGTWPGRGHARARGRHRACGAGAG
ncbi:hypothetical protein [Rhodovulum sulfidophilum]|uniref:hypothetical protein n=1 Tax=Rhodovulum sulfidophilum TaxID=35806 RepID=UPI00398C79D4